MASAQQRALNPTATLSSSSTDPDEEEFPKTSSGILHEDVGKLPTTPSTGEWELPREKEGQEAAGPSGQGCSHSCSAPGCGRNHSSGQPQCSKKRRASSAHDAPQPCKKPPSPPAPVPLAGPTLTFNKINKY